MTIYEIKRRTAETAPYFFSRKTMKFFKQTLKDFSVKKIGDKKYLITAKSGVHTTARIFDTETNTLTMTKGESYVL